MANNLIKVSKNYTVETIWTSKLIEDLETGPLQMCTGSFKRSIPTLFSRKAILVSARKQNKVGRLQRVGLSS